MENERILLQAKGHRSVTPLVVTVFFVVLTGLLLAFGRGTFLGMTIFLAVFLADVVLGIVSYFVRPRPVVTITDKRVHGYSYVAPRRRKRRGGNNIRLAIFSVVFKAIRLLLAYLFDYGSVAKMRTGILNSA